MELHPIGAAGSTSSSSSGAVSSPNSYSFDGGLRQVANKRIIKGMLGSITTPTGWKLIIVDDVTLVVLANAAKMFDLTHANVTVVEKLNLERKQMRDMEAVYFITPTQSSIDRVIRDFDEGRRMYAAAHLYFTGVLPNDLFTQISRSPAARFIKNLKEMHMEFNCLDERGFLTIPQNPGTDNRAQQLSVLFSKSTSAPAFQEEIARCANQIVSVFATMECYPTIRYSLMSALGVNGNPITMSIAATVQQKLDDLLRLDETIYSGSGARPTLVIVDRSIDMLAPLLHEFTYEAMVYDLLSLEDNKYRHEITNGAGKQIEKTFILDCFDSEWRHLRHKHIADCSKTVVDDYNKFRQEHKAIREFQEKNKTNDASGDSLKSIKDLSAVLRATPQYSEQLSKYSLHIHLAQTVMSIYNERKLEKLGVLEQDIVTGEKSDGTPLKNPRPDIARVLQEKELNFNDKLRLILIFAAAQGEVNTDEINSIIGSAGFSSAEVNIANTCLQNLAVLIRKGPQVYAKERSKRDDSAYEVSRYVPVIKRIYEHMADRKSVV